jgi:hypothetical protein
MGSFTSLNSVDVEGWSLVYRQGKGVSGEVTVSGRYGGWIVDGPALGGGAIEEAGGGVYGEGPAGSVLAARDGKHGGVVDGVAEDGVGCGDGDAAEGFDFVFVGGDVDEAVGDDAVVDLDAGAEDMVGGDVEAVDSFFDDPVVGGTDGPDVAAVVPELGDERGELGEDVGLDVVAEEMGGGGAEGFDGETAVDLGHVAADVVLGYGAALVAFVAFIEPRDLRGGDELGVDGPVHE